MSKGNEQAKRVQKQEMTEEILAMIQVCFEGEASLENGKVRLVLPDGEAFCIQVETAA